MLRVSSESRNESVDLNALMQGGVDSGIAAGAELIAFAEAIVRRDPIRIEHARTQLLAVASVAQMIEAAGVASNFQRMVRIANGTGIGLGHAEDPTADLRASLGIDQFRHHDLE
jgi:hypothetical protein